MQDGQRSAATCPSGFSGTMMGTALRAFAHPTDFLQRLGLLPTESKKPATDAHDPRGEGGSGILAWMCATFLIHSGGPCSMGGCRMKSWPEPLIQRAVSKVDVAFFCRP